MLVDSILQISATKEERIDPRGTYHKMTVRDLQAMIGNKVSFLERLHFLNAGLMHVEMSTEKIHISLENFTMNEDREVRIISWHFIY